MTGTRREDYREEIERLEAELAAAIAVEREACARVAEQYEYGINAAAAIRARKDKP